MEPIISVAKLFKLLSIFVTVLSLAATGVGFGQSPARVGILVQEMERAQSQAIKGLSEELNRLGHIERKNLFFETRNVKSNRAALQPAAKDLLAKNVNVIFTTGTSATRAAIAATREVPIVFVYPGNPIRAGLVKSAEERAPNVTGVAAYAGETTENRLTLFKEIIPALRKIVVFYDLNNNFSRDSFNRVANAARDMGLQSAGYGVKSAEELKTTFASMSERETTGIFQISDELVESEAQFLFATARTKKLPTMFNEESWAIAGALAAYGPNYLEMGRQAGRLVDKIIKGQKPASLSLERTSKFDLTLNYRTATFIGFKLPPEMIKKADKVIR